MEEQLRLAGVGVVALLGAALSVVNLSHLRHVETLPLFLLEVVVPLGFSLALIAAAGWLYREAYSPRELALVQSWMAAVVVVMLFVLTWTIGNEIATGHNLNLLGYTIVNNVTAGAVLGVVVGVYDVEQRRRNAEVSEAQTVLQRERDRFATLFENVPSPTIYYEYSDGDPIVIDVNGAFEDVFGYADCDVAGESIDDFVVPPGREDEAADLNRRMRKEDLQVEVTRRTASGTREFLLYTIPLSSEPNRGFATYVDITDQKRREQRLEVLNRVLRHDLRNAMNVIVGHVRRIPDGDDPEMAVDAIEQRADDLLTTSRKARTVERVLDATSDRSRPVELRSVLEDRLAEARNGYPELDVVTYLPDDELWVNGNELLAVAVDNLVENTARYCETDPRLVIHVRDGDPATITFNDNGPGIPKPELDVLDRDEETQLEHASGLGLWLVRWVVRDLGGSVRFENTATGAEVVLELPRSSPNAGQSTDDRTGVPAGER